MCERKKIIYIYAHFVDRHLKYIYINRVLACIHSLAAISLSLSRTRISSWVTEDEIKWTQNVYTCTNVKMRVSVFRCVRVWHHDTSAKNRSVMYKFALSFGSKLRSVETFNFSFKKSIILSRCGERLL